MNQETGNTSELDLISRGLDSEVKMTTRTGFRPQRNKVFYMEKKIRKITTGQTVLLIKECVDCSLANSGSFNRKKADNIINNLKKELKGAFITGTYYPANSDIRMFVNPTKITGKQIERFIMMKTYGAYIDWMNVTKYLNIRIAEPAISRLYDQMEIECWRPLKEMLGEARYEANRSVVNYRNHYEHDYIEIYKKFRNDVIGGWNNGLPSKEVMSVFEQFKMKSGRKICYTYKKRNVKSECNWIKGLTADEIARKLASKGIYELPSNYIRMLKEYRISVKTVRTELDNIRKSTSETQRQINKVINKLEEIKTNKPDMYRYYREYVEGKMDMASFIAISKAYGYDLAVNGKVYVEPGWVPTKARRPVSNLSTIYSIT